MPTTDLANATASSASSISQVGVVGAGTMGAGIAQVAAQAGFDVVLYDVEERFIERGRNTITSGLDRVVARGRMSQDERDAVVNRIRTTTRFEDLAACQLVVEAVPETLPLKLEVFGRLNQVCPPETILASNTSSLSVTDIARGAGRPDQVVGMHFFNPPPVMRLVEVVRGETTSAECVETALDVTRRFGKTPALCRDTPGFIVNRVARPFYLQGMAMLGEGQANVATIDGAMRAVGFPMGPFQLMDLIGIDVNFAVTRSVFEQRFFEARFRPHPIQESLVRAGRHGRKTGAGFYDYSTDPPNVALQVEGPATQGPPIDWGRLLPDVGEVERRLAGRTLCALINEAYFALGEGVANAEDIDTAMRLGTNYPKGLVSWGEELGLGKVLEALLALEDWYRDGRHIPAPLLRARA